MGPDVYENELELTGGLAECDKMGLLPHLGSPTREKRDKMAIRRSQMHRVYYKARRSLIRLTWKFIK